MPPMMCGATKTMEGEQLAQRIRDALGEEKAIRQQMEQPVPSLEPAARQESDSVPPPSVSQRVASMELAIGNLQSSVAAVCGVTKASEGEQLARRIRNDLGEEKAIRQQLEQQVTSFEAAVRKESECRKAGFVQLSSTMQDHFAEMLVKVETRVAEGMGALQDRSGKMEDLLLQLLRQAEERDVSALAKADAGRDASSTLVYARVRGDGQPDAEAEASEMDRPGVQGQAQRSAVGSVRVRHVCAEARAASPLTSRGAGRPGEIAPRKRRSSASPPSSQRALPDRELTPPSCRVASPVARSSLLPLPDARWC